MQKMQHPYSFKLCIVVFLGKDVYNCRYSRWPNAGVVLKAEIDLFIDHNQPKSSIVFLFNKLQYEALIP